MCHSDQTPAQGETIKDYLTRRVVSFAQLLVIGFNEKDLSSQCLWKRFAWRVTRNKPTISYILIVLFVAFQHEEYISSKTPILHISRTLRGKKYQENIFAAMVYFSINTSN